MRDSLIKLMPWMGGKGQLMWAIQMLLPIHYRTLVDVFGGSGIITLNTAVPKGCLQIYNDLNHDLYNLLFCVKHRPMALTKELSFLPINARDEFDVLRRQLQGEDFTQLYHNGFVGGTAIMGGPLHRTTFFVSFRHKKNARILLRAECGRFDIRRCLSSKRIRVKGCL